MKIDTLISDIYSLFTQRKDVVKKEDVDEFAQSLSQIVVDRLGERKGGNVLRMSNLGEKCDRRLWFKVNHPELAEELSGPTYLKFLIGDVWEAVLLFLARAAGHEVLGQQDTVNLHGVPGHRDAVIDGNVVDVKSASSRSFEKFEAGLTKDKDDFGYVEQLTGYLEEAQNDPLVTNKDSAFFLVGDKTLGKLTLDKHDKSTRDWEKLVREKQEMLQSPDLPRRAYDDVADGKSGNRKLGTACSYCEFKFSCWPNLKQYNYSNGPRYLTKVKKEPRVEQESNDPF